MTKTVEEVELDSNRTHIPDILDVIAALSSDAVPTPPLLARAMLDVLPEEVWSNPNYKWLDPATKSGSILREVAKRLMKGLADWEPDERKRSEHILGNMLYGCAITQVHGDMTRRSVYVSRDASGPLSVVKFNEPDGNLQFIQAEHDYKLNKNGEATGGCKICGAPTKLERGNSRENYAYAFIHNAYPTEEMKDMKFDVIVGNPPYQTGDGSTSESPLYHLFIERAIELNPKYVAMIVPSRWFMGGKGLDEFRKRMILDRRIRAIVDNPKVFDCFPGVEIMGGVNYFLWDSDYEGDCEFSTRIDGRIISTALRDLRKGDGVIIRDNFAGSIVEKCNPHLESDSIVGMWSSQFPFGQSLTTNYEGAQINQFEGGVPIIFSSYVGFLDADKIQKNRDWVNKWKVLVPKAYNGGQKINENNIIEVSVIGEPIAVAPGSICSQTYLVAGVFDSKFETENYAKFLCTKFVRFLVLQRKNTQDIKPDKFRFVPRLDMNLEWTDEKLYSRFKLTEAEIAYVEATIKPRSANFSLDSPIPSSHLPGGAKYRPPGSRDESVSQDDDE